MARYILLDSGPLGLACSRPGLPDVDRCHAWLLALEASGALVVVPTVVDYEVRRELVRLGATAKLRNLGILLGRFPRLDVGAAAFVAAAGFWAGVRRAGLPTAADLDLDGDAILAGLASTAGAPGDALTIATTNLRHFSRFPGVDAREWSTIS